MKKQKESEEAVLTDAYSLFVYAIRTQLTRDYYLRRLRTFFDFIELLPNSRIENRMYDPHAKYKSEFRAYSWSEYRFNVSEFLWYNI